VFWFNSFNGTDQEQSYLYRGKQKGNKDPKEYLSDMLYPSNIYFDDYDDDDKLYFLSKQ
jgi:hypothetical protein